MGDDRRFRELERLRGAVGPALCGTPAPCAVTTSSEVRIMPDGSEERTGAEPRPLCEGCPNCEARAVRHIEVRLDYRNRHGYEGPASAARIAHNGHDRGSGGFGPADDRRADSARTGAGRRHTGGVGVGSPRPPGP